MGSDREDQTLEGVQCGAQFVFSAEEQGFFETRGLNAPPKRCKPCRAERRKSRRSRGRGGRPREYRGPAFQDEQKGRGVYRSPAFREREGAGEGTYTAPAFRDREDVDAVVYTAPAFRDREDVDAVVYTAPAFKAASQSERDDGILAGWRRSLDEQQALPVGEGEHDLELGPPPSYREPSSPEEIYRSPAFAGTDPASYAPGYRRRETHDIVCAGCGRKSKVPFKPRKDRPVYCKECFASKGKGGRRR